MKRHPLDIYPHNPTNVLDSNEIDVATAGKDIFIRTLQGRVCGFAITQEKNPNYKRWLIVGKGPNREKNAQLAADADYAIPLYLKKGTHQWQYRGHFTATHYDTSPDTINAHKAHRPADEIAGILFLNEVNTDAPEDADVSVQPKTQSSEQRKRIEQAGIAAAITHFDSLGYSLIEDVQKENKGWDLEVGNGQETLLLEVKGTSLSGEHFYLTRNEHKSGTDSNWRLVLVSDVFGRCHCEVFTHQEMMAAFDLEPLAFVAKRRRP